MLGAESTGRLDLVHHRHADVQLSFGGCRLEVGGQGLDGRLEGVDLLTELFVGGVLRLVGVGDDLVRRLLDLVDGRVFELDVAQTLNPRLKILEARTNLGLVCAAGAESPG